MWRYLELLKLRREERRLSKEYRALVKSLRAKKYSEDDIDSHTDNLRVAMQECDEDREYLYHSALEQKAARLYISLPDRTARHFHDGGDLDSDQYWRWLSVTDRWVLRPKGIRQVRSEIREEQKARRDYWLGWFIPFAGIIAALLGYLLGRAGVVK